MVLLRHKDHHMDVEGEEDNLRCVDVEAYAAHSHHDHSNHVEQAAETVHDSAAGDYNHVEGRVYRTHRKEGIPGAGVNGNGKDRDMELALRKLAGPGRYKFECKLTKKPKSKSHTSATQVI